MGWNWDPTCMDTEQANMYGCTPCPKCKGAHRAVFGTAPTHVECDDCGHKELIVRKPVDEVVR